MRINTVATNLSGKAGKVYGTRLNLTNAATETMDATYNGANIINGYRLHGGLPKIEGFTMGWECMDQICSLGRPENC